jgi:signal transduction histidine kinase
MMADEEKTQQVLMTTHELKAPFSGIETNIQVLKIQYWDEIPESVHGIIDKIEARARTLRERIGEILILGDLKSYKTSKEEFVPVNLQSVTNDMIGLLSEKAKDRQISLDIQIPPITVMGNKNHLSVLLSNLVSNAIAYSHEGGKVKIAAENGKDQVSVTVTDHGIGIRDDALPHIFDEYYRTKEGAKFNKTSTGLGLSMVKEIARKYRIRIKVRSEMGKGTTFEVIIPKKEQTINIGG